MFDRKCLELANYFLEEYDPAEEQREWLAQDIQDQIERWFETSHPPFRERTP